MTDELRSYGEGTSIETMMSVAPKFYAFRAITPDTCATIECSKINFDSIKSLIDDEFGENADKSDNDTVKDKRTIKATILANRTLLSQ
ncbi:hypothetical protein TSAR_004964 [Trichomalopsis sarcophagae]|uniref:Uncharacterized protein n=1 Tax=Trichomalopsis sarcophagae TaxID=543379 RepID=A0A232EGI6_9HYME|nr:hypothetical protein TSAR_004964 [Trichomalopsis sarcophagae]